MSSKDRTEIWSIYGQIEKVVAEAMIGEGLLNKIPFEDMPATQQFDERGNRAHFAVVVSGRGIKAAFAFRVASLRA